MSTASDLPSVIPSPARMPPEVGSTLAAVWLSIGTGLLALIALWPMALIAAPAVFTDVQRNNLESLGWMTFGSIVAVIVVAGLFVSFQVVRKSRTALRMMRLTLLAGMVVGLALIIGMLVIIMQAKPGESPLGMLVTERTHMLPPVVSAMTLFLAGLLPFGFAVFALSYAGTDAVEAYFQPPVQPEEETYGGMMVGAAAEEVVGVVSEPAEVSEAAPALGGAEALDQLFDQELAEQPAPSTMTAQIEPADATMATDVRVRGRETMLRGDEPERNVTMMQPAAEEARPTMMAGAEALDQIFEEETAQQAAPPTQIGGPPSGDEPLSADALDAMFGEGDAEAVDVIPAGADPDMPASFSDSIFDEESLPPGRRGPADSSQSGMLSKADLQSTGESSIFNDLNTLSPGSGVISGMTSEPPTPQIVLPDSAKNLPPSKPTMIQPLPSADVDDEEQPKQ